MKLSFDYRSWGKGNRWNLIYLNENFDNTGGYVDGLRYFNVQLVFFNCK